MFSLQSGNGKALLVTGGIGENGSGSKSGIEIGGGETIEGKAEIIFGNNTGIGGIIRGGPAVYGFVGSDFQEVQISDGNRGNSIDNIIVFEISGDIIFIAGAGQKKGKR